MVTILGGCVALAIVNVCVGDRRDRVRDVVLFVVTLLGAVAWFAAGILS